jgi:hypothetical protein
MTGKQTPQQQKTYIHTLFIIIKAGPAVKNSEIANTDFDQHFLLVVS